MKILTYNIRGALGIDNKRSLARVADVVKASGADIVCMQEVGRRWPGSGYADQPKRIGGRLGMQFVYQPNILIGPAGFGNLILSRFSIITAKSHRLTSVREPRGLLEARLEAPDGLLTVFCTHWGLSTDERVIQANETASRLMYTSSPKLLCGDLNETESGVAVSSLLATTDLRDLAQESGITELTYPSDTPQARIDYIFGSSDVTVINAEVIDSPASDHRPVLVEVVVNKVL